MGRDRQLAEDTQSRYSVVVKGLSCESKPPSALKRIRWPAANLSGSALRLQSGNNDTCLPYRNVVKATNVKHFELGKCYIKAKYDDIDSRVYLFVSFHFDPTPSVAKVTPKVANNGRS